MQPQLDRLPVPAKHRPRFSRGRPCSGIAVPLLRLLMALRYPFMAGEGAQSTRPCTRRS
jgi:hypothetical protein